MASNLRVAYVPGLLVDPILIIGKKLTNLQGLEMTMD